MSTILDFFSGGKMGLIVAGLVAAVGIMWRLVAGAKKAGVDQEAARNAAAREKAHEQELDRIKAANRAGDAVDPGGVYSDPHNRTRTGKNP